MIVSACGTIVKLFFARGSGTIWFEITELTKMNTQSYAQGLRQVESVSFNSLRRILVVGPAGLLEEGVARLLATRQDLEVFHAEDAEAQLLAVKVAQIHPDVIILCHLQAALQNNLLAVLASSPALRIIVIHLRNMQMDIYQHNQRFCAEHTEFFPLVYGEQTGLILH
jgi:predicted amino acid dehydrogenase